jgi:IS5 family transposase
LEQHGLDKCPDTGIDGFKLYVSVGIVGKNIQRIGSILREKAQAKEKRRARKILKAA